MLEDSFYSERREFADPHTGRRLVQLTAGDCFDYALYYFIWTTTRDGRSIVFHRHQGDEVQLYRLDVATGLTVRLTRATTPNALWRPWLQPPAHGVRDELSAFNTVTEEAVYFDGNAIRCVQIDTLADRLVHRLAEDRVPCGLTGVSPDGKWFVFPHADRAWWEANLAAGPERHTGRDVRLELVDLQSGAGRTLLHFDGWITHSNFYDETRILFCHAPTQQAILMTDLRGGWYANLRTPDEAGIPCHYQTSAKGLMYEVHPRTLGLLDPATYARREAAVTGYRVSHIGNDPEGRLWFFEAPMPGGTRGICFMPRLGSEGENPSEVILGGMKTHWLGQRSHLHPMLMPDRRHLLITGGDARNQTNHLCLLDVADLPDTELAW